MTSRVQLALNVTDMEAAVAFYRDLFAVEPAKHAPGYANFEIVDPPLKLVLFENPGAVSSLNHLGVELTSPADVAEAVERFAVAGLSHQRAGVDRCCYTVQDKVWVDAPDVPAGGWEFYTVLADDPGRPGGDGRGVGAAVGVVRPATAAARRRGRSVELDAPACRSPDIVVDYGGLLAGSDRCRPPVNRGTTVGVLGHNGAGQDDLIRVLATLIRPRHQGVLIDGIRRHGPTG